jgi:hypothetical protein
MLSKKAVASAPRLAQASWRFQKVVRFNTSLRIKWGVLETRRLKSGDVKFVLAMKIRVSLESTRIDVRGLLGLYKR